MAGKKHDFTVPIDMERREEILLKLAESQIRSESLAQEIYDKRQRLADLQSRVGASSFSSKRDIAEKAKKELYKYPTVNVPEPEPEINIEDTPEYKAEMERVQKEVDAQAEQISREMKERCRVQVDTKFDGVSSEAGTALAGRLNDGADRYGVHAKEVIKGRSTDVLRTNKVVRDISRHLGANWKPVFLHIMSSFPADVVDAELNRIESERGYMQAYKALNTWKDMKGDDIVVSDLINALRASDLYDLAEKALDILEDSESDSLINVTDFGKGIKSASAERTIIPGRPQPVEGEEGTTAGEKATADAAAFARESRERLLSQPSTEINLAGALGDRKLLNLAKKVGHNWVPLAKALEIPNAEIQEIYNAEGDSYQGAFKAIYFWRDNSTDNTEVKVSALTSALTKINQKGFADDLLK